MVGLGDERRAGKWLVSARKRRRRDFFAFGLLLVMAIAVWSRIRPSNERDWASDQAVLATARLDGPSVLIRSLRDFRHPADGPALAAYDDREYDLERLSSVWFVLTPFSKDWRGPAHAFLSFGFSDSQYVAISVEARRERGESYSVLRGLLKRFEILYVIGDERDLIGLRAMRGEDVYVYPIRATPEQARELFTSMLARANALSERPEFYGSLRNNCTTNILRHVNVLASPPIRWGPRILLPGYSDEVAYERGLIDTDLSLEQARARFHVSEAARRFAEDPAFSTLIREPEEALGTAVAPGPS